MSAIDKTTRDKIAIAHPRVRQELGDMVEHINTKILTGEAKVRITSTLRTWEEQEELYAKGRTKPSPKENPYQTSYRCWTDQGSRKPNAYTCHSPYSSSNNKGNFHFLIDHQVPLRICNSVFAKSGFSFLLKPHNIRNKPDCQTMIYQYVKNGYHRY